MPLVRSFWLSTKKGRKAWVEPVVDRQAKTVRFEVMTGDGMPQDPPKIGRGAKFRCLVCNQVAGDQHIKDEGMAGRMEVQLMAIVAEGLRERIYFSPWGAFPSFSHDEHVRIQDAREGFLSGETPERLTGGTCYGYGLTSWETLFTPRQLVALTTFSDLVSEVWDRVFADAAAAGVHNDGMPLNQSGNGTKAYADAVATYLEFGVDKNTLANCTQATWQTEPDRLTQAFSRQALPMTWDYAEANPLSDAGGGYVLTLESLGKVLERLPQIPTSGMVKQLDATTALTSRTGTLISTDPPYYDNISYADLSDFFYVWLRRSLGKVYPDLFSTLLTPKAQELVATPYRFNGDEEKARRFFEQGLSKAFKWMRESAHTDYPLTIYYAFRQAETVDESDNITLSSAAVSTGWETMLEGLIKASFAISGTWPMRTELVTSLKKTVGALASSIIIVCRLRPESALSATRREFIAALKGELPGAFKKLQHGNIAPVDLAQAAIGPGMAVFSRYARVLEADGTPMRVRTALALINQVLDEVLAEQDGEFDADTRWALAWFDQFGFEEGPFGVAEILSKAKNMTVGGMDEAGILAARAGKVRLLRRNELAIDWDPARNRRITVWEVTQHLIRALEQEGETGAAALLQKLGGLGEVARDLAYRLYGICERKKWAQEALAYNSLVIAWPEIVRLAGQSSSPMQEGLF